MNVSVIIPTYNRADTIANSIRSVLCQTKQCYEVLIVDDHSNDNTEDIVRQFRDGRIRYLENRHSKGAQGARNTGVEEARGDWIGFLDSDDVWKKRKLERQAEYIASSTVEVHALSTGFVRTTDGRVYWSSDFKNPRQWNPKVFLYSNPVGGFSSLLVCKEALIDVGGLDEEFPAMQDMDLYFRLAKEKRLCTVPEHLTIVSVSEGRRISSNYRKKLCASVRMLDKYVDDPLMEDWIYTYRRANIAIYALLSRNWEIFLSNIYYILIGIVVCPNKMFQLVKVVIMSSSLKHVYWWMPLIKS